MQIITKAAALATTLVFLAPSLGVADESDSLAGKEPTLLEREIENARFRAKIKKMIYKEMETHVIIPCMKQSAEATPGASDLDEEPIMAAVMVAVKSDIWDDIKEVTYDLVSELNDGQGSGFEDRKLIYDFARDMCIEGALESTEKTKDEGDANPTSRTLLQVVWDIGAVNKEQAEIERGLGEDPLALIQLPLTSGWSKGMSGSGMREVNLNIAEWFVMDGSGLRGGAYFSVWCDNGSLTVDLIQVRGLKNAEGTATVEWAFDGERFARGLWDQKDNFILPRDGFPHSAFVRRLAHAKFLVLMVRGHAGLDNQKANTVKRPEDVALVPVSLATDRAALSELIRQCTGSAG